jgi:hypothetical protein
VIASYGYRGTSGEPEIGPRRRAVPWHVEPAVRLALPLTATLAVALLAGSVRPAAAQSWPGVAAGLRPFPASLLATGRHPRQTDSIRLLVAAGIPLRLALDHRIVVKRVGQRVTATLAEPVYVYDRIVLPVGTKVLGHVEMLQHAPKRARILAMLRGDFAPNRRVLLQFDSVISSGQALPIRTVATAGLENVILRVADGANEAGIATRARREISDEIGRSVSAITAPGKMERLKVSAIRSVPYHPDILPRGTTYTARLQATIDFGEATPISSAPVDTSPAPDSVLRARLTTPVGSAATRPGAPIEAVVTQPVFSTDHRLILPAGARLTGEVTYVKPARRFRRNGKLRFLFDTVHPPDGTADTLLASLHAIQVSRHDGVTLDEEGGTGIANSKSRFVAPALASLALVGSLHSRVDYDTDGAGPETEYGGAGSSITGGLLGFGTTGAALGLLSHPAAVVVSAVGVTRTVYGALFGKGRDVAFGPDTAIEVKLAPGAMRNARK